MWQHVEAAWHVWAWLQLDLDVDVAVDMVDPLRSARDGAAAVEVVALRLLHKSCAKSTSPARMRGAFF